jgi:hypothetical protein
MYRGILQLSLFMYFRAAFSFRAAWKAFSALPNASATARATVHDDTWARRLVAFCL